MMKHSLQCLVVVCLLTGRPVHTAVVSCMCIDVTQATADIALQGLAVLSARGCCCRALQEVHAVLVRLAYELVL